MDYLVAVNLNLNYSEVSQRGSDMNTKYKFTGKEKVSLKKLGLILKKIVCAKLSGDYWVSGDVKITDNDWVSGDAMVTDNDWVSGSTIFFDDEKNTQ